MKTKLFVASLVFVMAMAASARAADDDWKEFKSEGGGFSVLLPGDPKEDVQKVPTAVGDIAIHLFIVPKGNDAFGVIYSEYAEKLIAASNVDTLLDAGRDAGIAQIKGKLRQEKKITLDGNPGREITVDAPGGLTARLRFFMVKNRLYQIWTIVQKGNETSTEVTKMLESFKLTAAK